MKQISVILNVVLLAAIFLICFHSKTTHNNVSDLPRSNEFICDERFVGIPADTFMNSVARYKTTRFVVVNTFLSPNNRMGPKFEDSRCVWFSLDTLKKFICQIEKYSASLPVSHDSLGIRFYFGAYNKYHDQENPGRNGKHTLYMVPTTKVDGEKEPVDFDPYMNFRRFQIDPNSGMEFLAETLTKFKPSPDTVRYTIMALGPSDNGMFVWNNGRLCPSDCPTAANNTLYAIDNSQQNHNGRTIER